LPLCSGALATTLSLTPGRIVAALASNAASTTAEMDR
jgi:hypothetical protein